MSSYLDVSDGRPVALAALGQSGDALSVLLLDGTDAAFPQVAHEWKVDGHMRCMMQNPGPNAHAPAFALVTLVPSHNRVAVCQRDLNFLLDEIDEGLLGDPIDAEPADIVFLSMRP